jgi:hypothetical protein
VLAVDALELRRQRGQRPSRPLVLRVGFELDPTTSPLCKAANGCITSLPSV